MIFQDHSKQDPAYLITRRLRFSYSYSLFVYDKFVKQSDGFVLPCLTSVTGSYSAHDSLRLGK